MLQGALAELSWIAASWHTTHPGQTSPLEFPMVVGTAPDSPHGASADVEAPGFPTDRSFHVQPPPFDRHVFVIIRRAAANQERPPPVERGALGMG